MFTRTATALIATALFAASPIPCAFAGIINVPADFASIQDAINASNDHDEIIVAAGVYLQQINFNGKAVIVRSETPHDPTLTVIDGGGTGRVVTFNTGEGDDSRLIGFTITNGQANFGGGVLADSGTSPRIENCLIERNNANNGGGMATFGSPTLFRCWFVANIANVAGGGLYASAGANPWLDGCRFQGNDAAQGAAASIIDGAFLINCEAFDNVNSMAIALGGNAPVSIINSNVVGHGGAGIVLAAGASATATIANSIVANNASQIVGPPAMLNVRFSNVQGGFPGPGNISANPQFTNASLGDFRLLPISPCIDAGDNAMVPADVIEDFRGVDRISDRVSVADTGLGTAPLVDIGAHEFPPPRRYVNGSATGFGHGSSWNNAYVDLQDALDDARVALNEITEVWVAAGTYYPDRGTGDRFQSFEMIDDVEIIGGFAGGETDKSQNDPKTNQTVLGGAIGLPGETDNSCHVVEALDVNANGKLIGFIIQKGYADLDASFDTGGGIYINGGAPVFRDCWIRQNFAAGGGGVYAGQTDARFVNCRITINHASFNGGGMIVHIDSNVEVLNCYIAGNVSEGASGGILVYFGSTATLTNNTILGNTSISAIAGGVGVSGHVVATNNIIGQNSGSSGSVEEQQFKLLTLGTATIDYCHIQGWTGTLGGAGNSGAGAQLVDPLGLDGLPGTADDNPRLAATSPCVDAADGDALPSAINNDLDANDRRVDILSVVDTGIGTITFLDRGAFELQAAPCPADVTGDGSVNVADLLSVIGAWGPCSGCPADTNGDGQVNVADLLTVIAEWGACP